MIVMLIRRQRAIIANWQILLNVFSSTCSIRLQTKFRMNNYSTNTLCRLNCRWWILGWLSLFNIFFSVLHVVKLFMVLFNKNVRLNVKYIMVFQEIIRSKLEMLRSYDIVIVVLVHASIGFASQIEKKPTKKA